MDGGHIAGRFGIDKLAVQLAEAQAHPSGKWKWFNGQRGVADVEIRKGAKAHLYLYDSPTGGPMADLEFNPSRLIDSEDTWALCPVEDVTGTLEEVLAKLATHITPGEEPEMMRVSRLDVARDFLDVPNINATLRALSVNDPKWCEAKQVWFSTDGRNLAETLKFGGQAEYLQLYDKAAQMKKKRIGGRAPEGTLRYEVRARKDGWLGSPNEPSDFDGINVMAHVTSGRGARMATLEVVRSGGLCRSRTCSRRSWRTTSPTRTPRRRSSATACSGRWACDQHRSRPTAASSSCGCAARSASSPTRSGSLGLAPTLPSTAGSISRRESRWRRSPTRYDGRLSSDQWSRSRPSSLRPI